MGEQWIGWFIPRVCSHELLEPSATDLVREVDRCMFYLHYHVWFASCVNFNLCLKRTQVCSIHTVVHAGVLDSDPSPSIQCGTIGRSFLRGL